MQPTSTSLNLHAHSQLSMSALKMKAIAWLALQIILISSELEGSHYIQPSHFTSKETE